MPHYKYKAVCFVYYMLITITLLLNTNYIKFLKKYCAPKIITILNHVTRPYRKERCYSCYILFISSTYEYFSYIL
jgi:hypothetical protein